MFYSSRRTLACTLVLLTSGLLARAQIVSFGVDLPSASPSWTQAVYLPAFDPSWGVLNGVQLTLNGFTAQAIRAENLDPVHDASYTLESEVTFSAGRAGESALVVTAPTTLGLSGQLAAWDGVFDYSGVSGLSTTQNLSTSGSILDANLAGYVGTDPLAFFAATVLSKSIWTMSGSASSVMGSTTTAFARLEIQYNYTAIPEPADYALWFGGGALLLAVFRRKSTRFTLSPR